MLKRGWVALSGGEERRDLKERSERGWGGGLRKRIVVRKERDSGS